jgi:hypothetical protein
MTKLKIILIAFFLLSLASCVHKSPSLDINHSAVELRQFQKREFTSDKEIIVMKAVVGALQDLGFTIKNANSELGIINSEMQLSDSSSFSQYMQSWIFEETTISSVKHWDSTINVDKISDKTVIVRASFVAKALNKVGGIIKSEPILDPKFYQDFFIRIDKALFLKQNNL